MTLGAVNLQTENLSRNEIESPFDRWRDFPFSRISHHGAACCETAREWLFAYDFSLLNGASRRSAPRWIRARWNWGPTVWQIHWCEALREKELDCGALAFLAHEVFTRRGVRSFPVQLIQKFSASAIEHWRHRWQEKKASPHWLAENLIYHEGCAILTDADAIKIYDPSAGWWANPRQTGGYGSIVGVKICGETTQNCQLFRWGENLIEANRWQKV